MTYKHIDPSVAFDIEKYLREYRQKWPNNFKRTALGIRIDLKDKHPQLTDRLLRYYTEFLLERGIPILSDEGGYWYGLTPQECRDCAMHHKQPIAKLAKKYTNILKIARSMNQTKLAV